MFLFRSLLVSLTIGATLTSVARAQQQISRLAAADCAVQDPRTPISSLPYTITEAGSYYLTKNLEAPNGSTGIQVDASFVTIDLNGFTLSGTNGVGDAIRTGTGGNRMTIRNGVIFDWAGWGVNVTSVNTRNQVVEGLSIGACDAGGILLDDNSRITDCTLSGISGSGIEVGEASIVQSCSIISTGVGLKLGSASTADSCIVRSASIGIDAESFGTLTSCTTMDTTGDGYELGEACILTDCKAINSGEDGFSQVGHAILMTSCVASNTFKNAYDLDDATILRGCAAQNSGNRGFNAISNSYNMVLTECVSRGSSNDGFQIDRGSVLANCASGFASNDDGFELDWARAQNCVAQENGDNGFELDRTHAFQCSSFENNDEGFLLQTACTAADSASTANDRDGFRVVGQYNSLYRILSGNNFQFGLYVSGAAQDTFVRQHRLISNGDDAFDDGSGSSFELNW